MPQLDAHALPVAHRRPAAPAFTLWCRLGTLARSLASQSPVLSTGGAICVLLAAVGPVLMLVDPRTILGIDPWIKPTKFLLSFIIYLWTFAVVLPRLGLSHRIQRALSWCFVAVATLEVGCIGLQSARGVTSHYNVALPFDERVFQVMGLTILANTLLVSALLLRTVVARPLLDTATRWGLRFGLLVFVVGSFEGLPMIFNQGHSVGLPDGGAGLPFLNWSIEGGDLRVAHFLGLHALQILPLFGLALDRWCSHWSPRRRALSAVAVAIVYLGLVVAAFQQAAAGHPFIGAS